MHQQRAASGHATPSSKPPHATPKALKIKKQSLLTTSTRSITNISNNSTSIIPTTISLLQRSMATRSKPPKGDDDGASAENTPTTTTPKRTRKKQVVEVSPTAEDPIPTPKVTKKAAKAKSTASTPSKTSSSSTPPIIPSTDLIQATTPPKIAKKSTASKTTKKAVLEQVIDPIAQQASAAVSSTIAKILNQSDRTNGNSIRQQVRKGEKIRYASGDEEELALSMQNNPFLRPNTQQTEVNFDSPYAELFAQANDELMMKNENNNENDSTLKSAKNAKNSKKTKNSKTPPTEQIEQIEQIEENVKNSKNDPKNDPKNKIDKKAQNSSIGYHHPDQFHDPSHYSQAHDNKAQSDGQVDLDDIFDQLNTYLHSNAPTPPIDSSVPTTPSTSSQAQNKDPDALSTLSPPSDLKKTKGTKNDPKASQSQPKKSRKQQIQATITESSDFEAIYETQIDPQTGLPLSTTLINGNDDILMSNSLHGKRKKNHISFSSGLTETEDSGTSLESFVEEISTDELSDYKYAYTSEGTDDFSNAEAYAETYGDSSDLTNSEDTLDDDLTHGDDFHINDSSKRSKTRRSLSMLSELTEDELTDDPRDHIRAINTLDNGLIGDDLDDMDDEELRAKLKQLKQEGKLSNEEIDELHRHYHEMRDAEINAGLSEQLFPSNSKSKLNTSKRPNVKSKSKVPHDDDLAELLSADPDNNLDGDDTSEFTTSEPPMIPQEAPQEDEMPAFTAESTPTSDSTTQHTASNDDKPPSDLPNNDDGDKTAPGGKNNNNDGKGGKGGKGDGEQPQRDKKWPKFDKDVYSRLYEPRASTSPKLSSCLILPLSHTIRPLFPGLYCPVVVRDPAIVTEILKQTNKGFPYVGVFLKKGKNKDDAFMHKTTIHPTDSKKPPLLLNNNKSMPITDENTIDGTIDPDNLHHIGTFAHIFNITHLPNGAIHMILVGLRRIELGSVKYDLVPDLDAKGINALVNAVLPGSQAPPHSSSSSKKGSQHQTEPPLDIDQNTMRLPHQPGSDQNLPALLSPKKQSTTDSPITMPLTPHPGQSKSEYSKMLLDIVMDTGISKYPQYTDPSTPPPPNTKRVLIGNITHYDEETLYSSVYHEDGTRKSPLELSREEQTFRVYTAEILSAARELLQQSTPGILEQLQFVHSSLDFSQPGLVADFVANFTNGSSEQMQHLLSTLDVKKRLHLTLLLIKREVEMSFIHTEIQKSVEEHLQKTQREFYLKQQLSQIKKELGQEKDGGDSKMSLPIKFKSRVKERWDYIPQYAKTVIEEELSKLETLDSSSSEYNVTRNYLEWLTVLPWDHSTDEIYDISRTEQTLNEEHYGMQDVKDRILEFVAVGKLLQKHQENTKKNKLEEEEAQRVKIKKDRESKLGGSNDGTTSSFNIDGTPVDVNTNDPHEFIIPIKKSTDSDKKTSSIFNKDEFAPKQEKTHQAATGKIMLFVGPPGVGKTSIGKSIAKSLNREFYRFSVGGLSDVSEIKGHRRTYVGALPGKIVQALKKTQCSNPVILIDEIDKIGRGANHGDPSSALLEVLDPEQNSTFVDHYMDIPLDLSKVLFICTANSLDTISGPLKDRMDIVQLSGYIQKEKEHIAKHYIEPQLLERCGLTREEAEMTPPTIAHLVKWYCREAGVRRLQKYMEMIYRKVAFRVVRNDPLPIRVTPENLSEYIGQELYQSDRLYERTPVGVVAGLAWSRAGGSTMYIESAVSHNVFNRKKWGLSDIKKKNSLDSTSSIQIGDDGKPLHITPRESTSTTDSVDSIEIFDVIGGNMIKTVVDVVTKDTTIVIESNDKATSDPSANNKNKKDKADIFIANSSNESSNIKKADKKDDKDDKKTDKEDEEIKEGGSSGSLKLTGSLGEVMKESASIAYTLSKYYLHKIYAEYEQNQLELRTKYNLPLDTSISTISPLPQHIKDQLELIQQDNPIDPLYCKIPILRPPLSNSSTSASKVTGTYLNVKQADLNQATENTTSKNVSDKLQQEMDKKLQELQTLQQQIERMGQITSCEDDLFAVEIQPIIHENPQRTLKPGATYTTPSSIALPKHLLPVPDPNFFNTAQIHIHAPQGATPKDGPSAGIALLSCLLSQALNRPLVNNLAMTGEISLTGKVLPIGGLREKILGARQSNIFHLIVPKSNMHDIAELPAFITSGLTIYFAETADEVIRLVFGAPHVLSPNPLKPTLIKKYDTYDGDVDLEILKYQSEQAKKQKEQRESDEKIVTVTDAQIVQ